MRIKMITMVAACLVFVFVHSGGRGQTLLPSVHESGSLLGQRIEALIPANVSKVYRLTSISPDGRWMVFDDLNLMFYLYDRTNGEVRPWPESTVRWANCVGWSPSGQTLVAQIIDQRGILGIAIGSPSGGVRFQFSYRGTPLALLSDTQLLVYSDERKLYLIDLSGERPSLPRPLVLDRPEEPNGIFSGETLWARGSLYVAYFPQAQGLLVEAGKPISPHEICRFELEGDTVRLTTVAISSPLPGFAGLRPDPSGNRWAVVVHDTTTDLDTCYLVERVDQDPKEGKPLITAGVLDLVAWTPDGSTLLVSAADKWPSADHTPVPFEYMREVKVPARP